MNTRGALIDHAIKTRDFILDLLFPVECLGCGLEGAWLCDACFRSIEVNRRHTCPACGRKTVFSNYCRFCRRHYELDGVWVAGQYNNPVLAGAIKRYKYDFVTGLAGPLGRLLALYLNSLAQEMRYNAKKQKLCGFSELAETVLMPVPLHWRRKNWRGFNQAGLLAAAVANTYMLELNTGLARTRHTKAQAKQGRAKRRRSLRNAFAYNGTGIAGRRILLLDDVTTTGTTLNECAKVLKSHGAKSVWGLVVAKG